MIGQKRREFALRTDRTPRNGAPVETIAAMSIDIGGARCERAGRAYLDPGVWWNDYTEGPTKGVPDLEINGIKIDIKGMPLDKYRLVVQHESPEEWAYVAISWEHHPVYWLKGWAWGYEVKLPQYWSDPAKNGCPAFFYSGQLRNMTELYDLARLGRVA